LKAESGNEEKEEEELKLEITQMREGRLPLEFRDRAKSFAAMAIRLYVKLPMDREEVRVCGKQLLRAGTSVAAHVREASRARSDAEFISKLGGALQETDETQLWLELLSEECRIQSSFTNSMHLESNELIAIITSIIRKTNERKTES
jgi:four helix bundle protein